MKILLILPRFKISNKRNFDYTFPIGFSYISSVIKNENYDVTCLNLNHYDGSIKSNIKKIINKNKFDVICTTLFGTAYFIVEKMIKIIRKHKSKPIIILGGALVTSEPELILRTLKPHICVLGEGEITIIKLLNAIENRSNLNGVNGIAYLDRDKFISTPSREVIKRLDLLPLPDFTGFEYSKYLDNMPSNGISGWLKQDSPRIYFIIGSRGCPYKCTFCYHCSGDNYRERSVSAIIGELKENVIKYKINTIIIYDEILAVNKNRLIEITESIKELIDGLSWPCSWFCNLTAKLANENTLKLLKDSGCHLVGYGFESISEKVLSSMKKISKPSDIMNAFHLTQKNGIAVQANFIFGDRAETLETAKETLDFWKNECKGQVSLYFVQPYPGSEIYKYCIEKNILKDKIYMIKNIMGLGKSIYANMTYTLSDQEYKYLIYLVYSCAHKYNRYIVPKLLKKTFKNLYTIEVDCPFCLKKIIYKRFKIENKFTYSYFMICRECNNRFYIKSKLNILAERRFYFLSTVLNLIDSIRNLVAIIFC